MNLLANISIFKLIYPYQHVSLSIFALSFIIAVFALFRIAHKRSNIHKVSDKLESLRALSQSIVRLGPHAQLHEVLQTIAENSCNVLDTDKVAIYTIDPCIGGMDCSCTPEVTQTMQSAFLDLYQDRLTDRGGCHKAWVLNTKADPGNGQANRLLSDSGIDNVVAAAIRSEAGATGAVAVYYSHEQPIPELYAEFIESIASISTMAISYTLTVAQLQDYLEDFAGTNQELSVQATIDSLTSLPNRRMLQQTLTELCISSRDGFQKPFSLIMVDVDHFKIYNDTYGHQAGDSVLRKVAKVMSTNIGQGDLAARYGGEEFAIVVRSGGKECALSIAEQIRILISNQSLRTTPITVSMGVAEYPRDGITPVEVIEKSDQALYHAKITGRNRTVVFDGNSQSESDAQFSTIQTGNEDMAA